MTTRESVITQERPVPTRRVGRGDIVGFGDKGVTFLRNNIQPTPQFAIADFGYSAGNWRVDKHPRLVGDTTGDGLGDIVGFGYAGVLVSSNNGNSFSPTSLVLNDFGYDAGNWRVEKHVRYVSDLRKKRYVDIIGFGDAGVLTSLNNGDGSFAKAKLVLGDFGYNAGNWRIEKHLRFLADVTGNGTPDIIGFGETNVFVALGKGDGTFDSSKVVVKNDLTYSGGNWRIEKHPRTVADLTGKGRVDIIGFGDAGVYVALNNGDGTFQAPRLVVKDFGAEVAGNWRVDRHPRFVADITGDGRGSIVGFGDAGVYVALGNGDGTFQAPKLALSDFGYVAGGWRVENHPRFVVDLTGDGAADIIGFGNNSVWVSYNDGKGNFGPAQRLTNEFSFNGGWTTTNTVRWIAHL